MLLSHFPSGKKGVVRKIFAGEHLFKRLASMGLVEGSGFVLLSTRRGSSFLLDLGGKVIAIGRGMAEKIEISEE